MLSLLDGFIADIDREDQDTIELSLVAQPVDITNDHEYYARPFQYRGSDGLWHEPSIGK